MHCVFRISGGAYFGGDTWMDRFYARRSVNINLAGGSLGQRVRAAPSIEASP